MYYVVEAMYYVVEIAFVRLVSNLFTPTAEDCLIRSLLFGEVAEKFAQPRLLLTLLHHLYSQPSLPLPNRISSSAPSCHPNVSSEEHGVWSISVNTFWCLALHS